jgi:hypothetical protein
MNGGYAQSNVPLVAMIANDGVLLASMAASLLGSNSSNFWFNQASILAFGVSVGAFMVVYLTCWDSV